MKFIYEFISGAASAAELVIIQGFGLYSGIESMDGMGTEEGTTTNVH